MIDQPPLLGSVRGHDQYCCGRQIGSVGDDPNLTFQQGADPCNQQGSQQPEERGHKKDQHHRGAAQCSSNGTEQVNIPESDRLLAERQRT